MPAIGLNSYVTHAIAQGHSDPKLSQMFKWLTPVSINVKRTMI